MPPDRQKELFFHVGIGRTGTTYLQHRFFPKLQNIHYIRTPRYRTGAYAEIIHKGDASRYLVSYEFDKDLEAELHNIAARFPQARIIMVLRRQDQWIASQYRRMVKNGYPGRFKDFFDVEEDKGDWKQRVLYFSDMIRLVEQLFEAKPLVLLHDELKQSPFEFFDKMAAYMDAGYDREAIDLNVKHASYTERQLRFLYWLNTWLPGKEQVRLSRKYWLRKVQTKLIKVPRHLLMQSTRLMPDAWLPGEPLIDPEELRKVRAFYEADWQQCLNYVRQNTSA